MKLVTSRKIIICVILSLLFNDIIVLVKLIIEDSRPWGVTREIIVYTGISVSFFSADSITVPTRQYRIYGGIFRVSWIFKDTAK